MKKFLNAAWIIVLIAACNPKTGDYDASGTFEAVETIVSSEATGSIEELTLEEGQQLSAGQYVGYIDSLQLHLKKKQLESQIRSLLGRTPDVATQTNAYKKQLAVAQTRLEAQRIEQTRIENLLKADAATPKQLDDVNASVTTLEKELDVIRGQETAQTSSLRTQVNGLVGETVPLRVQIEQIQEQLANTRIINPFNGTVISKYAEPGEMTSNGKALYKIADISTLILRAYITGDQLASVKLNQAVTVLIDGKEQSKSYPGVIEWISSKAEFTPKTIQTREERANLVYAIKVRVRNDGYLKIGMYADLKFK